jgi:hypothetical protein
MSLRPKHREQDAGKVTRDTLGPGAELHFPSEVLHVCVTWVPLISGFQSVANRKHWRERLQRSQSCTSTREATYVMVVL